MFNITEVLNIFASSLLDISYFMTSTVGYILGFIVALLGLGFGYNSIKRYITGNSFNAAVYNDVTRSIKTHRAIHRSMGGRDF